jgi:hypothetical protein
VKSKAHCIPIAGENSTHFGSCMVEKGMEVYEESTKISGWLEAHFISLPRNSFESLPPDAEHLGTSLAPPLD